MVKRYVYGKTENILVSQRLLFAQLGTIVCLATNKTLAEDVSRIIGMARNWNENGSPFLFLLGCCNLNS